MKTKLLIGLGALAVVLGAGAAWAMGPGHRGHMMEHMLSARIERALRSKGYLAT